MKFMWYKQTEHSSNHCSLTTDRSGCSCRLSDSNVMLFSFNTKDEIYSSSQMMLNLVSEAFRNAPGTSAVWSQISVLWYSVLCQLRVYKITKGDGSSSSWQRRQLLLFLCIGDVSGNSFPSWVKIWLIHCCECMKKVSTILILHIVCKHIYAIWKNQSSIHQANIHMTFVV